MNTNNLITDISFLYELSLSVGQSLDKRENSERFLSTLMSRKNLEFGCIWIHSYMIPYSETNSGYKLIYAYPHIKISEENIEDSPYLESLFNDTDSVSTLYTKEIADAIGFNEKEGGAVTFYKLGNLGFLVLYSSSNAKIWNQIEQTKLKNVINNFVISLKACLFHEKSIADLITISKTKKALEKAKKKADESNELKSAFLSNFSHEFRTPINSILAYSNLLVDPDIDQSKHADFAQHITTNGTKLLKMVNNLLDVSKMDAHQVNISIEEFNPNQLLREIETTIKSKLINNNKVEFALSIPQDSNDIRIKTDRNKLIQILDNLIDNALKFTHSGSVEFGYYLDDNKLPVFYIRDTGIGISDSNKNLLFEMFSQLDYNANRKFEGFGLGLTLCRKLINLLHGEIWFDSEENIGSNFYFRLSGKGRIQMDLISSNNSNEKEIPVNKISTVEYNEKTILIAEDVKSNFNYLNAIIELTETNVIWAKNGLDAISICEKCNPRIDLVLMDLKMPEIGGLEAIKRIKTMDNSIPVIVQTAFTMNNEREECLNAGADDFITKPIDPQQLISILDCYL